MYAIIETGGKQYRVEPGEVLDVELISGTGKDGEVSFDRVLMVSGDAGIRIGTPAIEGATVKAKVVAEVRGDKVRIFKKKRRKQYRRTNGHRQDLHRVKIEEIAG